MGRKIKRNAKYKSVTRQLGREYGTIDSVPIKPNEILITDDNLLEVGDYINCKNLLGNQVLIMKGQFYRLFKEVK